MLPSCLFLLPLTLATASKVTITGFAVPSYIKASENVELQCQYSLEDPKMENLSEVRWWWTPLTSLPQDGRQRTKTIYQRIQDHVSTTHFTITETKNHTIVLTDLQPTHSGTYECEVSNDIDEARQSQRLVVYTSGEGPSLNWTIEKDETGQENLLLTCKAEDVAPEPELVLFINKKEKAADIKTVGNDANVWDIAISANVTEVEAGAEISCELFYRDTNITHPLYIDSAIYDGSGGELSTTEALDTTTEWHNATDLPDGSHMTHFSWMALLVSAALAHILAPV